MRCRYCCRHFRRIVINGFVAFAMILFKVFLRLIEIIQKPKRCDTHRFWDYRHPVMFKLNIESEGELCATWSVYGFCSAHSSISMLMIARYSFIKLFIFKPKTLYGNFLALQKCKLKCSLWEKLFLYFKIRVYGNKKFFNFLNRIDDWNGDFYD